MVSDFDALITDAEREPFSGWDFSYITATNRYRLEPVSCDYRAIVLERMKKAESMLDMGTGGGERLASLQTFPEVTYATEAYAPNAPIARKRLEPLGVRGRRMVSQYLYRIQPARLDMVRLGPTDEEVSILSDHFNYLKSLTEQGVVLVFGRTQNNDSSTFGITIFRAESEDTACSIMNNDPAVRKGLMRAELFPYKVAGLNASNWASDSSSNEP